MKKRKSIQIFGEVGMQTIEEGVDLSTLVFEFIHSGKVYTNKYGDVQFSPEQLQEIVDNFNNDVAGMEIAVDINHDPEKRAYAWIEPSSMYVAASTKEEGASSLYGRLYRFTPEGDHFVRTGAFRYFSIEVHFNVKRYLQGKLQTFKNVLMGLALTNFPAIKGLAPTFSDNFILNHDLNMDTLKIFLSALAAKAIVSKEDKKTLSAMAAKLTEEEMEEVKDEIAEVEAKPEVDETKKAEKADTDEDDDEEEEEKKEDKELSALPKLVTKLSSVITSQNVRLAALEAEKKQLQLTEAKKTVMLSNSNPTGFTKDAEKQVGEFMSTLNDSQLAVFKSLVSMVKTVELGEAGAVADTKSDNDIDAKAQALSETMMKNDPSLQKWEALSNAYEELGA